jgi:TonB family protein
MTSSTYKEFPLDRKRVEPEETTLLPDPGVQSRMAEPRYLQLRRWVGIPLASAALMLAPGMSRHPLAVNSMAADSVPVQLSAPQPPSLDLGAQRDSKGLRFTWNRLSPSIVEAQRGVVRIKDGTGEWRLDLDQRQLVSGSLDYWPVSNDVTFRLEVISASKIVSESVRSYAETSAALPAASTLKVVQNRERTKTEKSQPMPLVAAVAVKPAAEMSEEGFTAAKPIRKVRPTVPAALRNSTLGDTAVDLRVYIDREGNVFRSEILPGRADNRLLNAAADAAKRWRFEPARLGSKPVESKLLLHFTFNDPI